MTPPVKALSRKELNEMAARYVEINYGHEKKVRAAAQLLPFELSKGFTSFYLASSFIRLLLFVEIRP